MPTGKCLQGADLWFSPSLRPLLFIRPVFLPNKSNEGIRCSSPQLCAESRHERTTFNYSQAGSNFTVSMTKDRRLFRDPCTGEAGASLWSQSPSLLLLMPLWAAQGGPMPSTNTHQIHPLSLQGSFPCSGLLEQGRNWSLSQKKNFSGSPNSTPVLPAAHKPKAWGPACCGWLRDTCCPVITIIFLSTTDGSICLQCGALYRGVSSERNQLSQQ